MAAVEFTREWVLARCNQLPGGGCWPWSKATCRGGYGKTSRMRCGKNKFYSAHRVAYEVFVGPIPPGMMVLHRCDNPPCVNPDHLFTGTAQDNMSDAKAKGRLVPPPQPPQARRGESHPRAILKEHQARAIRDQKGVRSQRELAREFGVSRRTIRLIHNGTRWATLGTGAQG